MIVQAHQQAAGAPKKSNEVLAVLVGDLSTKIHAAIGELSNLTQFYLIGCKRDNITAALNRHSHISSHDHLSPTTVFA